MPDLLNKQAIVNLLIDSPLREPIKINLIDIVNNTNEPDLPKVYSTITKELEIFQKATERRMKLAEETIAKLGGVSTDAPSTNDFASTPTPTPVTTPQPTPEPMSNFPTPPVAPSQPVANPTEVTSAPTLPVAPLDLPPAAEMPKLDTVEATIPTPTPSVEPTPAPSAPAPMPAFVPLGGAPVSSTSDEDALAEIQKELDSLKTEAAADVASAAAPAAPVPAQ